MIYTNFNTFGPQEGETVTTTRPMTRRERKKAQKKAYSAYVACTIDDLVGPELLKGREFKDIVIKTGYDGWVANQYTIKFEYDGLEPRYTILNCVFDSTYCNNKSTILYQGDVCAFQETLNEWFDLCQMARILKLVDKQIKDYRALQGNKPQLKVVTSKEVKKAFNKVDKFDNLEKFEKDYKKLMAKYPDIKVYGDYTGNVRAYAKNPLNGNSTLSITL